MMGRFKILCGNKRILASHRTPGIFVFMHGLVVACAYSL